MKSASEEKRVEGYTIYECILEGARARLEELAASSLPFFNAWYEQGAGWDHSDSSPRLVNVSFDDYPEFPNFDVLGNHTSIPEDVFLGISIGNTSAHQAFLNSMLPLWRASWIAASLSHELHADYDDHQKINARTLTDTEVAAILRGVGAGDWLVSGITAAPASKDVFDLSIEFQLQKFDIILDKDGLAEYDIRVLPFALSWKDYLKASGSKENLTELLGSGPIDHPLAA